MGRKPLPDVAAYRHKIQTVFLPYYARSGGFGAWAIIEKASGEFIGTGNLRPGLDTNSAAEMGYGPDDVELGFGLRKPSWGRGYATEVARALVRRAFTELGAASVVACVTDENVASVRVLQKAGLRQVGEAIHLPGEDERSLKFALTKNRYNNDVDLELRPECHQESHATNDPPGNAESTPMRPAC